MPVFSARLSLYLQILLLLMVMFILTVCSNSQNKNMEISDQNKKESTMVSQLQIGETTVGRIGDWRIGIGNIFDDEYKNNQGKTLSGPVVTLHLYHPEFGEKDLKAYPGKIFALNVARFVVKKVVDPIFGKGHVVISRMRNNK